MSVSNWICNKVHFVVLGSFWRSNVWLILNPGFKGEIKCRELLDLNLGSCLQWQDDNTIYMWAVSLFQTVCKCDFSLRLLTVWFIFFLCVFFNHNRQNKCHAMEILWAIKRIYKDCFLTYIFLNILLVDLNLIERQVHFSNII